MSFSNKVKEELASTLSNPRHCRIAELAGIVNLCGAFSFDNRQLAVLSENPLVLDKAGMLAVKLFGDAGSMTRQENGQRAGKLICSLLFDEAYTDKIMNAIKADVHHTQIVVDNSMQIDDNNTVNIGSSVYRQSCCKRAYLRGAFLAAGSISDPEKDYHLELVTPDAETAQTFVDIISCFDIDAKTVARKKYHVVYVKDSEHIVDLLNVMEAHVALMELENIRILKDMRNSVNRRVNCETANIGKTIAASGRQIDDISYIRDTVGLDRLSPELRATAQLRLMYPDSSLTELGSLHDKPIGRSGVNHRLQRLSEIAAKLRSGIPIQ